MCVYKVLNTVPKPCSFKSRYKILPETRYKNDIPKPYTKVESWNPLKNKNIVISRFVVILNLFSANTIEMP